MGVFPTIITGSRSRNTAQIYLKRKQLAVISRVSEPALKLHIFPLNGCPGGVL
jgi:hypothetical protein